MIPKVVRDLVLEIIRQGQTEETAILTELAEALEERYPGEKLEVNLEKMGVPTTDSLIDCIRILKIQYKLGSLM